MTNKIINLALVDDHELFRNSTGILLNAHHYFNVCFDVCNGQQLIDKLSTLNDLPDIIILDIGMPVMNGYETLPVLKKKWPAIKVLILSGLSHEYVIVEMIRNGANGYLPKDTNAEELYKALTDIANSGYYHSGILADYFHKMADVPSLNSMERQFLSLCCKELTYKEIGRYMNISSRTVESYREHLFEKLNVTTRTGLVMFAVKTGLI